MEIIGIVIYLFVLLVNTPVGCGVFIALVLLAMWLMVRRRSRRVKWATLGILVATGIYYVFCNDLSGPDQWLTADSPINWPKWWYYNWRLWWIGQIGQMTAWRAGMIVAAMLIVIKLYHFIRKYV